MDERDAEVRITGFDGEPVSLRLAWDKAGHHHVHLLDGKGKDLGYMHISEKMLSWYPHNYKYVYISIDSDYLSTERTRQQERE